MKTLSLLLPIVLLALPLAGQQPDLPNITYDYATPDNNVSPISIGMGALNVTYPGDFYANYSNPALIGANQYNVLTTSFRLRDNDQLTFAEAMEFGNVLKPKQFKYFTLVTKQAAWTYQPVAAVHTISETGTGGWEYHDYQLDKAQVTIAAKDESWQPIAFGLSVKYLAGRLVYLRSSNSNTFIDDKVKGFSTDLGVTFDAGNFTFGVASYDLLSRLWWENYPSKPLQSRMAIGAQYGTESMTISAGLQGKLSRTTDTTYHLGFQYLWGWQSNDKQTNEVIDQGTVLRLGLYSHDFNGIDNVNFTIGTGYNYNIFRFDFSLNNKGLRIRDSEYLFSLGVGLP